MKMNYVVLGTNDMQAGVAFYDALFRDTEIKKLHGEGRMTLWGDADFMFALAEPFDGNSACVENGSMIGFNLGSAEKVELIYPSHFKMRVQSS
ncbi:hypothetical protein [Algibacillus agarilyticus]|uniref:hypothetical protein n=1 Tax=Algibacillus agarilyticus TaxID=2234133 RepID=UPI000DD03556|nr:hypothetical protein [Algibacillus agarilyticus]